MGIYFEESNRTFKLETANTSYIFFINEDNVLEHLYYGKKINKLNINYYNNFKANGWSSHYLDKHTKTEKTFKRFYPESCLYEVPNTATYDKRIAMIECKDDSNSYFQKFYYVKHEIQKFKRGKNIYPNSFSKYEDEEILNILLHDKHKDVDIILTYVVYPREDVITRSAKIKTNSKTVKINRLFSFCLDLPNENYNYLHFYGDWSYERHLEKTDIQHGQSIISSNYGRSGHEENPSFILLNDDTTESSGKCYGFSLIYSGNFKFIIERNKFESLRICGGINDEMFDLKLEHNDEFECPEVVLTYSDKGLNNLSHNFHDFIRNHIITSTFVDRKRPILLNSREGFYFDFNTDKVIDYILNSKKIGNELFVLDDGWFTNRNDDLNGLGDWEIDRRKVDLNKIIKVCHDNNLKFGLWFEPEMINVNTNLYKEHPEFALSRTDENVVLSRHQLVLDMSNEDVVNYLYRKIDNFLNTYDIDYVKWDHNRFLSEIYSYKNPNISEGLLYHLCTLGTYKLFYLLTTNHPNVLFEGCASGGGRFDMGMLYYTPQIWCSDETDPIQRTFIQYGTSYIYPLSTVGAHVSKNSITDYMTKASIALFGTYGFEFNPSTLQENDINQIEQVNNIFHKYHLKTIINGDVYRLSNPFETNYFSMMSVSKDKASAVFIFLNYKKEIPTYRFIKLCGLDENTDYVLSTGDVISGFELMTIGINLTRWLNEFSLEFITLEAQ